MPTTQEQIDRLKVSLQKNTDATASNRVLVQQMLAQIRDAKDDPEELEAVIAGFEKNTQDLLDAAADTSGGTPTT